MDLAFFVYAAGLSAAAVLLITQFLKFKFVPTQFANKYPVPTNIILSLIASAYVVWEKLGAIPADLLHWLFLAGTIAVVAAISYNALPRNWPELRATEG